MKNVALYVSGIIFAVVAVAHFVRFKLGIVIVAGHEHHIPLDLSLYSAVIAAVIAVWMFVAALKK